MNVILLSGGSGQRLWPLSNNIRSKQFIKLFKNEKCEFHSMLQRVYHQIKEIDKDANIIIATAKPQVSTILNQLGKNVGISIEPSRRDTFPAIVLACSYLKDIMNVKGNDPIIVCPVDPYVDKSFFEVLNILHNQIKKGDTNLALCGINPKYPSEKFGYVIPKTKSSISDVKIFKEKPSKNNAEEYIKQGALWNGGVFAFKLDYVLDVAHDIIDFKNYKDLYKKYDSLDKISFDYAVVEKEKNIKVIKYEGQWKDLGTWDALTESIDENVIGKGFIAKDCENVHIVNETDLPIIAAGLNDIIISASPDGILVANKKVSSHIKPYVGKLKQDVRFAEKSWGMYRVLDKDDYSITIKIIIYSGCLMKYHSHNKRDETWTVISGNGICTLDGTDKEIKTGDTIVMKAGVKHKIKAITDLKIIEVQTGNNIKVEDKIKWTTS